MSIPQEAFIAALRMGDGHDAVMTPRELIDVARIPGGDDELRLFRRGGDFMIVLDRNELMNSRMSGSEEALATMTLRAAAGAPRRIC